MSDYELLAYRVGQLEKKLDGAVDTLGEIRDEVTGWKAKATVFSSMWGMVWGVGAAILTKVMMGEK